ncbi:MAG: FAD-dependent tricarballylate dehydrogenase TcuA [Betaproteobacteria bacterium]|nr:FAD-dependent tricarballylate dehydrogenase TcuA [Betaproteobacteria bacterium]
MSRVDVLVIGGGNAALCAALVAAESGAKVMLLESAPRDERGGNSVHTRNIRCMHEAPQDVLTDVYDADEYFEDLLRVTKGVTDETLARIVIRQSSSCRSWMKQHGVRFQPSLGGTLHLSRTNAFFLGGGKALMNAYYRSAERFGIQIRYQSPVVGLVCEGRRIRAALIGEPSAADRDDVRLEWPVRERIDAKTIVIASGGFESNIPWLTEAWGEAAANFRIRGCRFNRGRVLRQLIDAGAQAIGDPRQCHAVAIDARAPLYDGGIVTRVDCVSLGIVVNTEAQRFYDEGEDFWPKRYAIWGRLVAGQPQQLAWSVIDAQAQGRFMPPVFPGEEAQSLPELARKMKVPVAQFMETVEAYNASVVPGRFDHAVLDDCHTQGISPAKTHWALRIEKPPFKAYPLRPGITFTYLGVKVDEQAQVLGFDNVFAAGEIMAGNVLGQGYVAGIGMTIGTIFGRIAGARAATMALGRQARPQGILQ